jgi:hypothetical protein
MDITNPMWRRGQVPPPWPCESCEATKGEVSNLRWWSVVSGPAGLGPESDYTGEDLQRLWAADPSSRWGGGGGAHQHARDCLTVVEVWSWAPDGCFVPGRNGQLTVGHNIRLDSASSCMHGNEYELKKWRDC